MTSLESKINLQNNRLELLKTAYDSFKDKDASSISRPQVQTSLDVLESNWAKFEKDHERIFESKFDIIKNLTYVTENHYELAQKAYITSKGLFLTLLDELPNKTQHVSNINYSLHSTSTFQRPLLPKITLPQFAGDYQSWKPFCDLFTSLVIENPDLSDVAKMHYLKNSLVKEASQLISNFQVSGENFNAAWNKLKSRFENKRVLINKHLDDLFKLKPIVRKSAKSLANLMAVINESLCSLKALGSPTEYWDHIIVNIMVNRLDPETHEAWEIHLGASVEPPTLQELQTFVDGRARALENMEIRESTRTGSNYIAFKTQGNVTQKPKIHTSSVEQLSKQNITCVLCSKGHYLSNCESFSNKSPLQRKEFLISKKLCFNCLGFHNLRDCRSLKSCQKCRKRHHTLIHESSFSNMLNPVQSTPNIESHARVDTPVSTNVTSTINTAVSTNHALPELSRKKPEVLLATALVKVIGHNQSVITARALIDQGSEITFISEHLAQTLHLPRESASLSLIGIGGNKSATTRGHVSVTVCSIYDSKAECSLSAYILPKLTTFLPSQKLPQSTWPHIEGLTLADPSYMTPGTIDLIIGADSYASIILPGLIKGPPLTPISQLTIFGWILSGPVETSNQTSSVSTYHCISNNDVEKLLEKFWVQEEVPSNTKELPLSSDNQACENHFVLNHKRHENGRYEVRLPLKESAENLGDSHTSALIRLQNLQSRLSSDPEYSKLYCDFINEYEQLDHMSKVPENTTDTKPVFYLPHHGVLRSSSTSTKLRVVFNASQKTSSGKSLNDILYCGPKLQTDLSEVLTWFRRFKYVFVTDIEKMYRQISVHPEDWSLQRILWLENESLHTYQLKTVTYGLSCAPYLALRTIDQLILDEGKQYPMAAETLKRGRYVDDIFGGENSIKKCTELVKQVDELCASGCFPLKKWISNNKSILDGISSDRQSDTGALSLENSAVIKTLGLSWKPATDSFKFLPNFEPVKVVTKRNVLSRIAQFFDPLGFIAPFTIQAKVFMQQHKHLSGNICNCRKSGKEGWCLFFSRIIRKKYF